MKSPLVYTAPGARCKEPSALLLGKRLQAPQASPSPGYANPYGFSRFYGGYGGMSGPERWGYLRWLNDGRPTTRIEGYLILFLAGLERRALADGKDYDIIWKEIWRLRVLHEDLHYTFNYAAEELLWFMIAKAPDAILLEHLQQLAQSLHPISYWDGDGGKRLSLLVWWCTRQYGGLPLWMAFQAARISIESRRTIVLERAGEEMQRLFDLRFQERWGELVPLTLPPKARRRLIYESINDSLPRFTSSWPDPLKLYTTWGQIEEELVGLYNRCQEELRPLALLLGKEGMSRQSILAWEALPPELRTGPHPALNQLNAAVGEGIEATGVAITTAGNLAEILEIPQRESFSSVQAKRLGVSLGACNYGMEPDSRLTGKAIKWDEPVGIFKLPPRRSGGEWPVEFSNAEIRAYQTCALVLKLAFYVAHSGGAVSSEVATTIQTSLLPIFDWDELERPRFQALAALARAQGIEKAALRLPQNESRYDKDAVGQLLLKLVSTDSRIGAAQEEALRWAWKRLDLDARKLKGELDALSSRGVIFFGDMVVPGRGEKIPPPPPPQGTNVPLQLNREALGALLAETRHVQAALNEAMASEEEVATELVEPIPPPAPIAEEFPGLSPRYLPFLRTLLERDEWPEAEAGDLAKEYGVMLSGAIEAINDWAFEALESQLLWEDGENLTVERALLK